MPDATNSYGRAEKFNAFEWLRALSLDASQPKDVQHHAAIALQEWHARKQRSDGPNGEADARRYAYLLDFPDAAKHMLSLLSQGKGDKAAFSKMIDRCIASLEEIKRRECATPLPHKEG
mgnify:CR=1 FL=1